MEHTVVGVYDSYSQAENAMNELLSAGFSRDDVQLSPDSSGMDTSAKTAIDGQQEDTGSGIGNFFRRLFGMEEHRQHHDIYAEAVRRGSCVLTVSASSDEQLDRATDILNRYDPVDIDERSAHWRSQGWTGYDENAPRLSDSEIERERSMYAQGLGTTAGTTAAETGAAATGMGTTADNMAASTRADTTTDAARSDNLAADTRIEGEQRIPVVEEELRVGKREVQRGGVRVFQRVQEKPVHESVDLREEHVKVERHPVDQPASEADVAAFKEGTVELRETAEEPVVAKTARVVEEVVVGKEVTQRTEDINDTVRRTDVQVEQLSATDSTSGGTDYADTAATGDDADFRTHWQSTYGGSGGRYEDYDAAYRYGSTLSGSDRMKNYRWSDVEPDVRSDWESSHPESAWDKVKDAVRYGAERVTGKSRH